MGKIQKLREQKKTEIIQETARKAERNKTIILGILGGAAIFGLLIYGIIGLLNWRISSPDISKGNLSAASSTSPSAGPLFPSI